MNAYFKITWSMRSEARQAVGPATLAESTSSTKKAVVASLATRNTDKISITRVGSAENAILTYVLTVP